MVDVTVGILVDRNVGGHDGSREGDPEDIMVGSLEGVVVGWWVITIDGSVVGTMVGILVGRNVGERVNFAVGWTVDLEVGSILGRKVGAKVGCRDTYINVVPAGNVVGDDGKIEPLWNTMKYYSLLIS
jgi:hypothetical protein